MNRTKTSIINIFSSLSNTIIKSLIPFVLRTVLIYKMGTLYSGLGSLYTSILSVLNISELGFETAITYCMYKPFAEKNYEEIDSLLNYIRKVFYIVSIVIGFIGLLICPFLKDFIKGDIPSDINIYYLYIIYLVNNITNYLFGAYTKTIFNADQKTSVINFINTIVYVVVSLIQLVLLIVLPNYYVYSLLLVMLTVFTNLSIYLYYKRCYPNINPHGSLTKERKKEIITKVKSLFLSNIGGTIYYSSDSIIMSMFIGLSIITIYNNYNMVINVIWSLTASASISIIPVFANMILTSSKEELQNLYYAYNFGIMTISIIFFVGFTLLFQDFMIIWMGNSYLLSNSTIVFITLLFFVKQINRPNFTLIDASGLWDKTVYVGLFANLVNLILNIVLIQIIGINGVVLSTLFSQLFIQTPYNNYIVHKYILCTSQFKIYKQNIIYFFESLILLFVFGYMFKIFSFTGLSGFIIKGVIITFFTSLFLLACNYKTKNFKYVFRLLQSILKK